MKTYREFLIEAAAEPRIPHPEDSVFMGSKTAAQYVQALNEIAMNPQAASIKWDGMIALYFGRDQSGKFFVNDKYMPETFHAYSPMDWQKYDTTIKKSRTERPDLYKKLAFIWPGLEAAVGTTAGVFKGDLMFIGPLDAVDNMYQFKSVTVEYHVPVNSRLGKLIAGRRALIVAHQFNNAPYTGKEFGNAEVTVIPPNVGIEFKIKMPVQQAQAAERSVTGAGAELIDRFISGLPKTVVASIKQYFNHLTTGQTQQSIQDWLAANLSTRQAQMLLSDDGYITTNVAGLRALQTAWNAIAAYKESLAQQLESQVQGFKQYVAGKPQGEGFVFPSSMGLIKLVQKGGFGAAHFAGFNAAKKP